MSLILRHYLKYYTDSSLKYIYTFLVSKNNCVISENQYCFSNNLQRACS